MSSLGLFPLHAPSATEKIGPSNTGLVFDDFSECDSAPKVDMAVFAYRGSSTVVHMVEASDDVSARAGDVSRSFNSFAKLSWFFLRFSTAEGPL